MKIAPINNNYLQQNRPAFKGEFVKNAVIRDIVYKASIEEMIKFENLLKKIGKINDSLVFSVTSKSKDYNYSIANFRGSITTYRLLKQNKLNPADEEIIAITHSDSDNVNHNILGILTKDLETFYFDDLQRNEKQELTEKIMNLMV